MSNPPGFVMPPIPVGTGNQQVVIYNIQVPAPSYHRRKPAGTGALGGLCTVGTARTALVLCLWAAWAILIGGVARVQSLCNGGELGNAAPFDTPWNQGAAVITPQTPGDCISYFGQLWWAVFLQFTAILVLTAPTLTWTSQFAGLDGFFVTCLYMFMMSTIQLFFVAATWQQVNYLLHHRTYAGLDKDTWVAAATVVTVGAITCMIFNFFYLIWNTYKDPEDSGLPAIDVSNLHSAPPPADDDAAVKATSAGGAAEDDGLSSARGKDASMLPLPPK